MRFSNISLVLLFVGIVMSLYAPIVFSQSADSTAAVPGHWAKYIGSFPYEEYEWMQISILEVNGTKVNMSLSYGLRYPYQISGSGSSSSYYQRLIQTDIKSGLDNMFLFLVPPNLTIGETVPTPLGYPELIVNNVEVRTCAWADRTVISAAYSNMSWERQDVLWHGDGMIYWDKKTGLLLEIWARVNDLYFPSLKLVETNIWPINLTDWIAKNFVFLILAPLTVALELILLFVLVRRPVNSHKVSYPVKGKILIGVAVLLLVNAIIHFSYFDPLLSSISTAFSIAFLVTGVLIHTGLWADRNLKVDFGIILMSLSVTLFGSFVACIMYRELGALIPYLDLGPIGFTHPKNLGQIDVVFLYPLTGFASLLAAGAISLFVCGLFFKALQRSEAFKSALKIRTIDRLKRFFDS
jgi:hypothetical protein